MEHMDPGTLSGGRVSILWRILFALSALQVIVMMMYVLNNLGYMQKNSGGISWLIIPYGVIPLSLDFVVLIGAWTGLRNRQRWAKAYILLQLCSGAYLLWSSYGVYRVLDML